MSNYPSGLKLMRRHAFGPGLTTAVRRSWHWHPYGVYANQALSTDSIGNCTITLTNVVIGSAIRIEVASTGELVELRTADTTTEVFTLPYYTAGSANNDLRIKVRKGSSIPLYKPYETLATASVGSGSVYITQIPD